MQTLQYVQNGVMIEPSNYYFFLKQIKNLWIAIVLWIIIFFTPLKFIKQWAGIIFICCIILQLLVFTQSGFNWAYGWINITWSATIQPSEFFKIWFILFFAGRLLRKKDLLMKVSGFLWFLLLTGLCYIIFLFMPDLWTVAILWLTSLILYRYAWGKIEFVVLLLIIWVLWWWTIALQFPHIQKRFAYYLNTNIDKNARWIGRQTQNAITAIGAWGITGRWYGKWLQKFGYIPEAQSDYAFAAYSEEVWLLGNSILLTLYFLLCRRSIQWIQAIKDQYRKYVGVWLIWIIIIQTFINIGVNTGIVPTTGITLPFVSYGGTALMINIIQIVLLYKITAIKS
jgi:cell division protein FtsW